jgi:serine/threonine-protein kinase
MSIEISCPHCQYRVEADSAESLPTRCPQCNKWVTCPKCHSTLPGGDQTAPGRCPRCNSELTVGRTATLDEGTTVADDELPVIAGFDVLEKLGEGGMGDVYRARQHHPDRPVAIKVLHPELAHNRHYLDLFERETNIAGNLAAAHLLDVYAVVTTKKGLPAVVMRYIDGSDLAKLIKARRACKERVAPDKPHPWQDLDDGAYLARMLPVLDQVVSAVAALHEHKVLHRDIKPHNILLEKSGAAWLADFGLARLQADDVTVTRGIAGTRRYAPPEQAGPEGRADWPSDVFSVAATIYEALTLELPFGKDGAALTNEEPVALRKTQPLVPKDLEAVVLKALERHPKKRYQTALEFQDDWARARQGLAPRGAKSVGVLGRLVKAVKRRPWAAAAVCVIISLAAALGAALAPRHQPVSVRTVTITTDPPGADIVFVPLHAQDGIPLPDQAIRPTEKTPVTIRQVPVGLYVVVAKLSPQRFHEVYRTVPEPGRPEHFDSAVQSRRCRELSDGSVELASITIPPADAGPGMVHFEGGKFTMGSASVGMPAHERDVAPFLLDPTEVSYGAFKKAYPGPLKKELRDLGLDDGQAMAGVNFWVALDYAERVGKRLPDEAEYEFAATNGGTTRFPWGDDFSIVRDWPFGPVGAPAYDRTRTEPPVYGLFSNVAEWTTSWQTLYPGNSPQMVQEFYSPQLREAFQGERIIRGGPWPVIRGNPDLSKEEDRRHPWDARWRVSLPSNDAKRGVGFRCARSARPRY